MDRNGGSHVAYVTVNTIKMVLNVTAIILYANPVTGFPLMLFSEFSAYSYSSPNGLKKHFSEFQHSSILISFVFM